MLSDDLTDVVHGHKVVDECHRKLFNQRTEARVFQEESQSKLERRAEDIVVLTSQESEEELELASDSQWKSFKWPALSEVLIH